MEYIPVSKLIVKKTYSKKIYIWKALKKLNDPNIEHRPLDNQDLLDNKG